MELALVKGTYRDTKAAHGSVSAAPTAGATGAATSARKCEAASQCHIILPYMHMWEHFIYFCHFSLPCSNRSALI